MNTYELNKVFGAILFAGLTAMAAWLISLAAYGKLEHGHHERVIHYEVAGLEQDDAAHGDDAAAEEAEEPALSLAQLLADADPVKGQKTFKKCTACHTVAEGGKNKIGPNLWNVVNRDGGEPRGLLLLRRHGRRRGCLGLRAPEPIHRRPQGQRGGHQDGLQGRLQGRRTRRRSRLSPFP